MSDSYSRVLLISGILNVKKDILILNLLKRYKDEIFNNICQFAYQQTHK